MSQVEKWSKRLESDSKKADRLFMLASFLETIVVPIPIELVLIPYMIGHRSRIWWTATVVLVGCIAAALFGYAIGLFFMQSAGQWVISTFGWQQDVDTFKTWFSTWGFWAVIAVGIVPVPFQVAMLTAGAAGYPLLLFVLATFLARGVRYYGLALLVFLVGDRALHYWKAHSKTVGISSLVVVVAVAAAFIWLA